MRNRLAWPKSPYEPSIERRVRGAVALAVLWAVAACDPIYGVSREARVAFMPLPVQVDSILRSVPGVQTVQYDVGEGGRRLTLGGVQRPDTVYTFTYRGAGGLWGTLQFTVDDRHRVEYSQSSTSMGRPKPQREVDAVLPVMRAIEARLETRAGLVGLRDSVRQYCTGVRC